jgi:hypothetical protein
LLIFFQDWPGCGSFLIIATWTVMLSLFWYIFIELFVKTEPGCGSLYYNCYLNCNVGSFFMFCLLSFLSRLNQAVASFYNFYLNCNVGSFLMSCLLSFLSRLSQAEAPLLSVYCSPKYHISLWDKTQVAKGLKKQFHVIVYLYSHTIRVSSETSFVSYFAKDEEMRRN